MATYTDNLRLTKQEDNSNPNTWGTVLNDQVIQLIDEAIAGIANVDITGSSNVNLATSAQNGASDDARHAVLRITGTIGTNIELIIPSVSKVYIIDANFTGGDVTFRPTGGTGFVIPEGESKTLCYCNGTEVIDILDIDTDIPSGSISRTLLNTDVNNSIFTTGDLKYKYGSGSIAGWVRLNGRTIGSTLSGGTERANADTEALYTYLWNEDSNLVIVGGRGGSAAADFAANKALTLPDFRNRVFIPIDGMGNASTNRVNNSGTGNPGIAGSVLGATGGVDRHAITQAQLPNINFTGSTNTAGSHTHPFFAARFFTVANYNTGSGGGHHTQDSTFTTSAAGDHSHTVTLPSGGSDDPHTNVQPSIVGGTAYIKL